MNKSMEVGTPDSSKEDSRKGDDQEGSFRGRSRHLNNRHGTYSPETVNAEGDKKDAGGSRRWTEIRRQESGVQRKSRRALKRSP